MPEKQSIAPRCILLAIVALMFAPLSVAAQDEIEELGRLFIDPDQREKLEAVRRGTYKAEKEKESRVSNVRVDGVMMRSGGENVVWVNGENTFDGAPIEGVRINPQAASRETYTVKVIIDGKHVGIKPGQNWSEGTGTVKDNY